MRFSLDKYTGLWHELLHTQSFFQKSDTYNTTAEYTHRKDGSIIVLNTTYVDGKMITSRGIAKQMARPTEFRVDFDFADVAKFAKEGFKPPSPDKSVANYIIKSIWFDEDDDEESYKFALVTDEKAESVWVLSRVPNPSRAEYEKILAYLTPRFDTSKLVATPHYKDA